MDSLVEIDFEEWPKLQDVFKKDWPRGLTYYYLLETQQEWKNNGISYELTVYCPYGDIENGMVALTKKKSFYQIFIVCPQDDTSKLEEALATTGVVDWSVTIVVPFAAQNVVDCLSRAIPRAGTSIERTVPCDSFVLEKGNQPFCLDVPSDYCLGKLSQEHAQLVDSSWPYHHSTSHEYFSAIISAGRGYGLFLGPSRALVSWVLLSEASELKNLFTIQEYRKRGLAEIVLKHVSNVLLAEEKDVFGFTVKDNVKAKALFRKLGFRCFQISTWCIINPRNKI